MSPKTLDEHITTTPGVAGGKPHVAGHRVTVQHIAVLHDRLGKGADEIASEFDISLADVHAALAYYFLHREVIDQAIQKGAAFVEDLRRSLPSKVGRKLGGREH